ncbi:hypothetical protein ACMVVW_000346 [Escherichia coli]|nr:hypothetical protein [Escherichia coli]
MERASKMPSSYLYYQ